MNIRLNIGSGLILGLLLAPHAHAEPTSNVQIEVSFLLGYVDGSGCQFYRNGTWHNAQDAQTHLRDKYKWLRARNMINTTEDFIDRAATQSSFSGLAYAVACNGGASIPSNQWLRAELARLRTF
jgi:hypothetical protein